jgi:hypothetical protein
MDLNQIPRSHMRDFLNRPYSFNDDLKYNLRLSAGISIGMFLFYLFFQPLDLKDEDINNRLVIIAGFGFITFLILGIALIFLPWIFPKFFQTGRWNLIRDIILNGIIWILITTANTFYARYVGLIEINYHSMFKLLLLGLAPVAILIVVNQNKILKRYLQNALELMKNLESDDENKTRKDAEIVIESESKSESLALKISDLILIRSANNYIEIFWKSDEDIHKRLLRNTLTNVERQLKSHRDLIRCHRTAIINGKYAKKLSRGHHIKLDYIEEPVPVSRQHSLAVKEYLLKRR